MGSKMEPQPTKDYLNGHFKTMLQTFMKEMGIWEDCMEADIPSSYQKYQNYVLFKDVFFTHQNWMKAGPVLWKLISGLFGEVSNIALYGKINNDEFRTPNVVRVFGTEDWVECIDNGIMYTWKYDQVMFSRGNILERHRIGKLDCRNQVVVDMFAGIGYFTLPYLVLAKAELVYAYEWNSNAIYCLLENLFMNNVEQKCKFTLGNVKELCVVGVADHVNLGLIPSCEEYWETGVRALKCTGGVLHIHGTVCSKPSSANRTEALRTEHVDVSKCIKCVAALLSLNLHTATGLAGDDRRANFGMELLPNGVASYAHYDGPGCSWKKPYFLEWSIHVIHSIAFLLVNNYNGGWRVKPTYFGRIKKYAPHIFHVVLDVYCEPM